MFALNTVPVPSDAEIAEMEAGITKAFSALDADAQRLTGGNHRLLRDGVKKGQLRLSSKGQEAFAWMERNEVGIMQGVFALNRMLCNAFWTSRRVRGTTLDDYLQEGALAIYDAIYLYDGRRAFSTYTYESVKRRLIAFVRNDQFIKTGCYLSKRRVAQIQALMTERELNLRDAIEAYSAEQEKPLTKRQKEMVRDACLLRIGSLPEMVAARSGDPDSAEENTREQVTAAFEEANLSEIERMLLEGMMHDDRKLRAFLMETTVNPNTGKPWTRAALSNAYFRALRKVELALGERQAA